MSEGRSQHGSGFEERFTEAISEAGEAFRIEPTALVDTAWVRGRAIRRRRRVSVVAGAAALALVGVGGVAAVDGWERPVGPADGASARSVSGPEFQAMLTELLPQGTVEVGQAQGTDADPPQLRLTVDDGHGAAQYLFWITRSVAGDGAGCPQNVVAGDTCTESTTEAGRVVVYQSGTRSGEPAGAKTWSASLYTENGYHLMLQEWNRKPLESGRPITRVDPPLNPEQLTAVVTDGRWKQVEAALGAPQPPATAPTGAQPAGAKPTGAPPTGEVGMPRVTLPADGPAAVLGRASAGSTG